MPRGVGAALGVDVAYTLDGLGEADVVYALRMQLERMTDSFVPSMREYAINYQIDSRRLGPRQLLMHPGPVNRGIELSPDVIDGPASLITAQVESGLVVRMAVLYELLAGARRAARSRRGRRRAARADPDRGTRVTAAVVLSLDWRGSEADPRRDAGRSAAPGCSIRSPRSTPSATSSSAMARSPSSPSPERRRSTGAEVIEADGLALFPAFFDPHVHLRTPGREDKEDIETGTRAAAAGGYCGIVAMANTDPVVDTAADVSALRERAREQATVPVGFVGTVTKGMKGVELTEMSDLANAGAVGFSDDGLPIRKRPRDAPRASVPAPGRPADRPPRAGPRALGRRAR